SSNVRKTEVSTDAVVFNVAGVVAFAQASFESRSGSNLLSIDSNGQLQDALISGSAMVREFFVAPNGKLYVVFESLTELTSGGVQCVLAEVAVDTGIPSCIDSDLTQIIWANSGNAGNPPIQFDAQGGIYYAGFAGSSAVLRRYSNGSVVNLVNDNSYFRDFLVLDDGSVLLSGMTNSSNVNWLRRISPSGRLTNLAIGFVQQMSRFVDGNIYVGLTENINNQTMPHLRRYLVDSDVFESKAWISRFGFSDSYFPLGSSVGGLCWMALSDSFCNHNGASLKSRPFNISGKTFAVAGNMGYGYSQLWQYYPSPEKANVTQVYNVTESLQVGQKIVLAGLAENGSNILSVYDTSAQQETVVMDSSNEIEIYSMSFSARTNSILFSGLRFADNRFVVGTVNLG
ncbi:MAG: hypothetical protein RIR69_1071, partial [Actinomycetota bacterium]